MKFPWESFQTPLQWETDATPLEPYRTQIYVIQDNIV